MTEADADSFWDRADTSVPYILHNSPDTKDQRLEIIYVYPGPLLQHITINNI